LCVLFLFFFPFFFFVCGLVGLWGWRECKCNDGLRAVRRRQPGIPYPKDAAFQLFFCRSRPPGRGFRCADEGEPAKFSLLEPRIRGIYLKGLTANG
jgi:hypothetical protein